METYRIGVIADTHTPEALSDLPAGVLRLFDGVDLILHAGDITGQEVLETLKTIAPVIAVKGDHDQINELPRKAVAEIGDKRIGLIHGRRPRWQELPSFISNEVFASRNFNWGAFHSQVVHKFRQVDAIVFGHFHRPYIGWYNDVLLFNPGAVYQLTPERAQAQLAKPQSLLRRAYLLNARRRLSIAPTVGLMILENGTIKAEILPIPNI